MTRATKVELTSDELVLALVSLVRVVAPALLRQAPEGLTLDLDPLEAKTQLSKDELLLLKLRALLVAETGRSSIEVPLSEEEARRLGDSIAEVAALREWPADVQQMSKSLRSRLIPST